MHAAPASARTTPELVRAVASAYGDDPAVVLAADELSYRLLDARSACLARGLLARGVAKGSRVGLLLGNGPSWVTWWAALTRIGVVAIPLSTFAKAGELGRVIRHADLHALVMQGSFLQQDLSAHLEAAFPGLGGAGPELRMAESPFLRWVVMVDDERPRWCRDEQWILTDSVDEDLLIAAESEVHPEDVAMVIYTSGQSAVPKGVVHSHSAVLTKIHHLREMLGFERGTQVDAAMPFFWVGGLVMALLPGLEVGATVVCHDASTFGQLGVIGRAGTPANPYEGADLVPSLGMTETFGMYAWGRDWRVPGFDMAAPLDVLQPGFEIKVVDARGNDVGEGGRGEIVVRGPTLTTGLVKTPREEAFDLDGYYRTGDGAAVSGGRIHFVGRLGDMIKTSGANVSPQEVERELVALEGVQDAYVTALDNAERGQEVVAAVVATEGAELDPEDLRRQLRARISSYKVPRRIALIEAGEVPLTPSMKVARRALAELIDSRTASSGERLC